MKITKKAIVLILALTMILAMVPTAVFAEDPDNSEPAIEVTILEKGSDTPIKSYHESLDAAKKAVNALENTDIHVDTVKIKLLKDIENTKYAGMLSTAYNKADNYEIDLNGHRLFAMISFGGFENSTIKITGGGKIVTGKDDKTGEDVLANLAISVSGCKKVIIEGNVFIGGWISLVNLDSLEINNAVFGYDANKHQDISVEDADVKIYNGIFSKPFVDNPEGKVDPSKNIRLNDIKWIADGCTLEQGDLDADNNWKADPNGKLYRVQRQYKVLDGAEQTVKDISKGLAIRIDGFINDLLNVFVDGKLVDPSNYTLEKGSIIVNFHEEFLKSLENGKHEVTFNFKNDTSVKTTFTLDKPETKPETKAETTKPADSEKVADTADRSGIMLWTLSLLGAAGSAVYAKRKKEDNE